MKSLLPSLVLFFFTTACATTSRVPAIPNGSFSAEGTLMAIEAELPASVAYDADSGALRLDVRGSRPATVIVRWKESAGRFLIAGDRCSQSSAVPTASPDAAASVAEAIEPAGDSVRFVREKADGPVYLFIESEPFGFHVRLDSVTAIRATDFTAPAHCHDNGFAAIKAAAAADDAPPPAANDEAWISANHQWTGGKAAWVGPVFKSTVSEYEAQLKKCGADRDCEPAFRHQTYGWHCGPGWGKGQLITLDPLDAICRDHDRQVWGKTDWEGWCGMWSAYYCWNQSGTFAWSWYFPKSNDAYSAIRLVLNTLAIMHDCTRPNC